MSSVYTPPPPAQLRWLPGTQALRTCLALAFMLSACAALWSWPRDGSSDALVRAVATHDVRGWVGGDVTVTNGTWAVEPRPPGSRVVWQDSFWRTHIAPASPALDVVPPPDSAFHGDIPAPPLRGLGVLASLLALILLVRGRQPALATKWAWFWLGLVPPLCLGVLVWLAVEVPWSRRTRPSVRARPARPRLSGGYALAVAAVAFMALHSVLSANWA